MILVNQIDYVNLVLTLLRHIRRMTVMGCMESCFVWLSSRYQNMKVNVRKARKRGRLVFVLVFKIKIQFQHHPNLLYL